MTKKNDAVSWPFIKMKSLLQTGIVVLEPFFIKKALTKILVHVLCDPEKADMQLPTRLSFTLL